MSDEHARRTTHGKSEGEPSHTGFSGAFGEKEFERMKQSQHITIHDFEGMGSMSEFDVFVSFSVPTTVVVEGANHD